MKLEKEDGSGDNQPKQKTIISRLTPKNKLLRLLTPNKKYSNYETKLNKK